MRILGIDLGSKRIGLAISDERSAIAFPAGILASRGRKRDLESLCRLIREREVGAAVVGLPIHLDGRRGPEAEKATRFAEDLAAAAGIPVETLDERWTSIEAERLIDARGDLRKTRRARGARTGGGSAPVRRRGRNAAERSAGRALGEVDEVAASILLRTFLDRRARRSGTDDGAPGDA